MKIASKEYIISTVYKTNILPLISECNTSCIFCSHKQNPTEIEVFRAGRLGINEIKEIAEFLSPERKIVIGESATRIIEGEPLVRSDLTEIISMIRKKFSKTPIQITTNGILLNQEIIEKFVEIKNIELNISVNCLNTEKRKLILGIKAQDDLRSKLELLSGRIRYGASAVLVPEILDVSDIEEMAAFLSDRGADFIRLFMPGYTKVSKTDFDYYKMYEKSRGIVEFLEDKYDIPFILEPSCINDLQAKVEGVIKGTPSYTAGIVKGDVITKIDGNNIRTRVEAFERAYRLKNPVIEVKRADNTVEMVLKKNKNSSPGFVVLYDINPDMSINISRLVSRYKADNVMFVTSELAYGILKGFFEMSDFSFRYEILKAENRFFGGTIKCAGLLTVDDIIHTLSDHLREVQKPDLILLPPIMFDQGRDLMGRTIRDIENAFGINVDAP
jgi:wyosine [tRNA(Phe)-imidazoG37] synthetase (radical SAM superfamily)